MRTAGQLILIHFGIGLLVWFCVATIRGRMADRTYEARMSSPLRFFLMPGRLAERAVWVRQQRLMAWVGLVLGAIIYVGAMIKILA
jgi:hypothetical protein